MSFNAATASNPVKDLNSNADIADVGTGTASSLTPSSAPAWSDLRGISVYQIGSSYYAYASDYSNGVYLCSVNSSTGALSGCALTASSAITTAFNTFLYSH